MRRLMLVAILVLAAFVATLFAVLIGPPMAPGIDLGAYVQPSGGQSNIEAYTAFEQLGGELNVTRHYLTDWTDSTFGGFVAWSAESGNHPYVSLHAFTERTGITWAEIADGEQDAFLADFAAGLQELGVPVWFSFHHEPENDPDAGTASDFRAAAAQVYEVMNPACPNCQIGLAFMRGTFDGAHGGIDAWLPEPRFFDFLGADLYSRDGATQLADLAGPSLAKARSLGKPYVIGEAGTSAKKKAWLTQAREFLKANEDIVMFDYSQTIAQADYRVTTGGGLSAWKAITSDPFFDQPVAPAP